MIIYPPLINPIIPAFTKERSTIVIPYEMNPAVGINSVLKIALKISDYIDNVNTIYTPIEIITTTDFNDSKAIFTIPTNELNKIEIGQYYKFQIAYMDNNSTNNLTYSVASIGKCVQEPTNVYITDLNNTILPDDTEQIENIIDYKGIYERASASEGLYSYKFELFDGVGTLVESSGEQIWNINNDIISDTVISAPTYHLNSSLEYGKTYKMLFTIITINGLGYAVNKTITKKYAVPSELKIGLNISSDIEEGCININLSGEDTSNIDAQFVIERSDSGQAQWEEITRFSVGSQTDFSKWFWKDFSVEHGKTYYYQIRQFKNGNYSAAISSSAVEANFEHMFLSDGERQLKIKFNPQVSSFKTTLLESKMDTIGNKYPYFFRNNQVGYKEIPISGLISYLMDENENFINEEDLGLEKISGNLNANKTKTTNLTHYNIAAERIFKLEVLNWLNNGQPKLFRSPAEGNYVVRLMNVSLSPNGTLGRMLHTFSCTGYECAAADLKTLKEKEIFMIKADTKVQETLISGNSVELFNKYDTNKNNILYFDNIKNFVWTAPVTEVNRGGYVEISGEEIRNYKGIVETPYGEVYSDLTIVRENNGLNNSWFSFTQLDSGYNSNNDNFTTSYRTEWSQETSFNNKRYVYYIAVCRKPNLDDSILSNVTINGEIISLNEDNVPRVWRDVWIETLSSQNADITMYYASKIG